MSVANFVPEYWAEQLERTFRKAHVFSPLTNRKYEGTIARAGDTVKITTPGAITVAAYSGSVTYQTPSSTQQSLLIDQDLYWAFELDDLDQAQANVEMLSEYIDEGAYALAQKVDVDLAGLYTASGLDSIALDLGTDDFYDKMVLAGQQLDEENVARDNRWVAMTPKGYADLLKNDAFIHATDAGDAIVRTGALGMVAGFRVHVSNNIVNSASNTYQYMYGTNAAITVAGQLQKLEALRGASSFDDQVRMRYVYGRKVIRPTALGAIASDET